MKTIYFILSIVVLLTFSCNSDSESQNILKDTIVENVKDVEEITFKQEQLEQYYKVYEEDYVIQLRTSFNNFLTGEITSNEEFAKENLEKYQEYIKNKFIVLNYTGGLMGGMEMQIIFPSMPDKVFYAWIYKLEDSETYELRDFEIDSTYTEQDIKNLKIMYKTAFEDEEHSL